MKPNKMLRPEEEWRRRLTADQYRILRQKGTEPAFTGKYLGLKEDGVYLCVACGMPLFSSEAKYDSRSGWPSFVEPIDADHVELEADTSLGMRRTEVLCASCESHLGHVFPDGPAPTGQRFCINSASLRFEPEADAE